MASSGYTPEQLKRFYRSSIGLRTLAGDVADRGGGGGLGAAALTAAIVVGLLGSVVPADVVIAGPCAVVYKACLGPQPKLDTRA